MRRYRHVIQFRDCTSKSAENKSSKMIGKVLAAFLLAFVLSESYSSAASTSHVVCYHGNWYSYKNGNGKYTPENIDPNLCTHIIYSFLGLKADGTIYHIEDWLDLEGGNLEKFVALRNKNKNLKVLVALGGWNHSKNFGAVAASPAARARFLKTSLELIERFGLDGLDFDWEYPTKRDGSSPADYQNFITLLKEFKEEFEKRGLLLTIAVSASPSSVNSSYDVPKVSKYVDLINVMAYDLNGAWNKVTGHNAPLYASSKETGAQRELNVDAAISNWLAQGAAPEKLVLGIPTYGRAFRLASTSDVSLGAPASGPGDQGKYTGESGFLGYNEIVELRQEGGWTYVWDDEQKVPHMYKGLQWVGFDDVEAVTTKVKYAQEKNLGGVMVWALETDDHHGLSGIKNPLLTAISKQLDRKVPAGDDPTTVTPSGAGGESSKPPTVTPSAPSSGVCTSTGSVRDPKDCSKFYICSSDNGRFVATALSCPGGLYFDTKYQACNYKEQVLDC
ncbi:unnamed protein product [Phyllotreta striolata]|uniref:chitinase n=1 Tax=Phyllotreta striolata TaxID=444603 RepID=A0A9N9TWG9_PHYSR|nr:unnamed protein product [Phyllotreta striolata]